MLNKYELTDKMSKHFSRWMDIRKRTNKSNGGILLGSIAESVENINQDIINYKKDFFIRTYMNKTEDIIDSVLRVQIGNIDKNEIEIEGLRQEYDPIKFYDEENSFYIEDGYMYLKREFLDNKDDNSITYKYKGYDMNGEALYYHVWNIYDEFATFVGIKRYHKESNKNLLNRILYKSINKPNSNEQGLKNAIKNAVINFDNLKDDEIIIKGASENVLKNYENEFDDILEELTFINKDVLRAKRWDIDLWNYNFNNVNYIGHKWNAPIKNYKDGTGYNDSLKINITNKPNYSNLNVIFYEKSEQIIEEYIKNQNIDYNIELKLTKYEDQLEMKKSEYNIIAETAQSIESSNVSIDSYNLEEGIFNENITELLSSAISSNIKESLNMNIENGSKYKIKLRAKENNVPMIIRGAYKKDSSKTIDLMDKFITTYPFINKNGEIHNSKCFKYANRLKDFISIKNMKYNPDTEAFEMDDINNESVMKLNVDNGENKFISLKYNVKDSFILREHIITDDFFLDGYNHYKVSNKYGEMSIKTKANYIALDVKGKCEITVNDETITVANENFEKVILVEESDSPKEYNIKIKDFNEDTEVKNLKYKNYKIDKKTLNGKITKRGNIEILPDEKENELTISMKTYTGSHINVEGVYIGHDTINDFIFLEDVWDEDTRDIQIDSNCIMDLYIKDELVKKDFKPNLVLTSLANDEVLNLNLENYSDITFLNIDNIKKVDGKYYVKLNKGESISNISLKAKRITNRETSYLNDILKIDTEKDNKIYISNAYNGFVVEKNKIQIKKELLKEYLPRNKDVYQINNVPKNCESVFIVDKFGTYISETKMDKDFISIAIRLLESSKHIAYNTYEMYNTIETDIDIINNFVDPLDEGKLMFYHINSIYNNLFEVTFNTGNDWSIGRKQITIKSIDFINKPDNYQKTISFVNKDFILSKEIFLDKFIEDNDLTKCILEVPEGHEIVYKRKEVTDNIEDAPEFYRSEIINNNNNRITKLNSSNIDDIIYIGQNDWNGENQQEEIKKGYKLLKDEGIIIWDEILTKDLLIVYTIKIPHKIVISDDILYNKVSIPITAYKKVAEINKSIETEDDVKILLTSLTNKEYDIIDVNVDNPNLDWFIENDYINIYTKNVDPNSIAVNPGYYYVGGKEYYMYNTPTTIREKNYDFVTKIRVERIDNYLVMKQEAWNMINNSDFNLLDEDTIYYSNFEDIDHSIETSSIKNITACDNYNYWKSMNSIMSLVEGKNGLGIKIKPLNSLFNNYVYIEISDYIKDNKHLSFYADKSIDAYIGVGADLKSHIDDYSYKKYRLNRVDDYLMMNISQIDENNTNKLYLIIEGTGMFDDIVLSPKEELSIHKKNISSLNIPELTIKDKTIINLNNIYQNSKLINTEINNNFLTTESNIHWNETRKFSFNNREDWKKFKITNIDLKDNKMITTDNNGKIQTSPIEIDDKKIIESLIVKINDMDIENYKGFETTLKTGHNINNVNEIVEKTNNNLKYYKNNHLKRYVAFDIVMPANTVINSIDIYIEYKEDYKIKPKITQYSKGECLTKIFEASHMSNYRIKDLKYKVEDSSYINIYVRAGRRNDRNEYVWTDWKRIEKDNKPEFINYKLFQFKINVNSKEAKLKIDRIRLEEFNI